MCKIIFKKLVKKLCYILCSNNHFNAQYDWALYVVLIGRTDRSHTNLAIVVIEKEVWRIFTTFITHGAYIYIYIWVTEMPLLLRFGSTRRQSWRSLHIKLRIFKGSLTFLIRDQICFGKFRCLICCKLLSWWHSCS